MTNDGGPKRWVVVRPPGSATGLLIARADGPIQAAAVGNQVAGRVGFFLRVDEFEPAHQRMSAAGLSSSLSRETSPTDVLPVFVDVAGNRGPPRPTAELIPPENARPHPPDHRLRRRLQAVPAADRLTVIGVSAAAAVS